MGRVGARCRSQQAQPVVDQHGQHTLPSSSLERRAAAVTTCPQPGSRQRSPALPSAPCRRLRSLDVKLDHPGNAEPYTLPLPLASLPEGLTHLRLHTSPPVHLSLPAGDYLRSLRHLTLSPMAALRIAPLLPFMPDVSSSSVGRVGDCL